MLLFTIIFLLVSVGVMLWLLNTHVSMNSRVKKVINVVLVTGIIICLLKAFDLSIW